MLFHGSIPVCAHHVQCTLRFLNYSQISSLKYTQLYALSINVVLYNYKLNSRVIVVNITKSTQHPDFL